MNRKYKEQTNSILRTAGRNARRSLSAQDRNAFSRIISAKIAASAVFTKSSVVMLYKATEYEVNPVFLETASFSAGKTFVYPFCTGPGKMIALRPLSPESWHTGSYGIIEPVRQLSEEISPEIIDLVICPLTAFDGHCRRIGSGKGYYDRFLPECIHAVAAGAAFEVQKMQEIDPAPWDKALDIIFTEENIYRRT